MYIFIYYVLYNFLFVFSGHCCLTVSASIFAQVFRHFVSFTVRNMKPTSNQDVLNALAEVEYANLCGSGRRDEFIDLITNFVGDDKFADDSESDSDSNSNSET